MAQSHSRNIPSTLLRKMRQLGAQTRLFLRPASAVFPSKIAPDNGKGQQPLQTLDKRQHPRVALRDTAVHVTDGCLFATAHLGNISPAGLCLCNLPEQLYKNSKKLTVFSSDNPGLPVLQVEPRWQKTGWNGKNIGAVILNTTDAWRLFFVHTAGQASL